MTLLFDIEMYMYVVAHDLNTTVMYSVQSFPTYVDFIDNVRVQDIGYGCDCDRLFTVFAGCGDLPKSFIVIVNGRLIPYTGPPNFSHHNGTFNVYRFTTLLIYTTKYNRIQKST